MMLFNYTQSKETSYKYKIYQNNLYQFFHAGAYVVPRCRVALYYETVLREKLFVLLCMEDKHFIADAL